LCELITPAKKDVSLIFPSIGSREVSVIPLTNEPLRQKEVSLGRSGRTISW